MTGDPNFNEEWLLDIETGLYQGAVFEALLEHGGAPQILPAGMLLFAVTAREESFSGQTAKAFADALVDVCEENSVAARVEPERFVVLLSHVSAPALYCFAERLAQRMETLSLLQTMTVSVVFKHWSSLIQRPLVFYGEGLAELRAGKGLQLQFIAARKPAE